MAHGRVILRDIAESNMSNPKTLDDWLAAVSVYEAQPPYNDGAEKWHGVEYDGKPLAIFSHWRDAYRWRLDFINRNLNPTDPTE